MTKIKTVLMEENRLLRDGIASMLRKEDDISVSIAESESLISSIYHKGIVLLGALASSHYSLQVVRQLKTDLPFVRTVMINIDARQDNIIEFVEAGVYGFILKDACNTVFIDTVRAVDSGRHVLPMCLTAALFSKIADLSPKGTKPLVPVNDVHISRREQEIIALITEGLSNNEIALRLHLSVFTIKSHIHNILNKLAMNTRIQISNYANRSTLIP